MATTEPALSAHWTFGGMVPARSALPDVLPADRLTTAGRLRPGPRAEVRRNHDVRNALNVASVIVQSFGVIGAAVLVDHPLAWVAAFVLMGRSFALYLILAHEAAHRLLFSNRRINDLVGRWVLAHPGLLPFDVYRRSHMGHHREAFGPTEPDLNYYANYPIPAASFRRKLARDVSGISGWRNLVPLLRALGSASGRRRAVPIVVTQVAIFALLTAIGGWWVYPLLWLLPWMTVWRLLNRLRSVAEHGGLHRSGDERETTHHVRQSLVPRFWIVPFNTGWHLAHHVDPSLPFQELPGFHAELVDSGWVTEAYTWPDYRSLWRAAVRP